MLRVIPWEYVDKPYPWATFLSQTVYADLNNCDQRGELRKLAEVTKMPKNTRYVGSRSYKVIVFGTNQKSICNFVLVVTSNSGRISQGFGATATYWSKSPQRHTPYLI